MIPTPKLNPMITALRVMTDEEVATEGVCAHLTECISLPASVRAHIGSVFSVLMERDAPEKAIGAVCESVVIQMAGSIMHSQIVFSDLSALKQMELKDAAELQKRVNMVRDYFCTAAPALTEKLHEVASRVNAMQSALVKAVVGTKNLSDDERLPILQNAFDKGEYDADSDTGGSLQ